MIYFYIILYYKFNYLQINLNIFKFTVAKLLS
jgi:hypothetical protein